MTIVEKVAQDIADRARTTRLTQGLPPDTRLVITYPAAIRLVVPLIENRLRDLDPNVAMQAP